MTNFEYALLWLLAGWALAEAAAIVALTRRVDRLERLLRLPDPDEVGVDRPDHH